MHFSPIYILAQPMAMSEVIVKSQETMSSGNILDGLRAESDRLMLENAFVETPDYHALTSLTS